MITKSSIVIFWFLSLIAVDKYNTYKNTSIDYMVSNSNYIDYQICVLNINIPTLCKNQFFSRRFAFQFTDNV